MDKNTQFLARTLLAYMAGVMIGFSAFLVAACMITGCCTTEERAAAIQAAKDIAQGVTEAVAQIRAEQEPTQVEQPASDIPAPEVQEPEQTPTAEADEVDFALLSWDYGGFKGGKATLVDGCRIAALKVSASGMSYKWGKGGCEQLGASSRTAADCIATLFVQGQDGKWRGGKFDWISTSRTSRDFENIRSGYHGWPTDAIAAATGYAFVIVSADGKKRTNVIRQGK